MRLSRLVWTVLASLAFFSNAWAAPVTCDSPQASTDAAYEYFVTLADAQHHLVRVQVRYRSDRPVELAMPVWNALYQVRDFAQYVSHVQATGSAGQSLAVEQVTPSSWRIPAAGGCGVFSYLLYADAPGPFGTQFDSHHAFLNWAQVLVYPRENRQAPLQLTVTDVPAGWSLHDLGLFDESPQNASQLHLSGPVIYDRLVDSPVELASVQVLAFEDSGARYRMVIDDPGKCRCDFPAMQALVQKIVHAAVDWMQDRPYDQYTFLYHFPQQTAGSGMEHANGAAIDVTAETAQGNPRSIAFLTAHEFFHLWNVKRIRPQGLEPIDYSRPQDTRALWFSEGTTSTVAALLMVRAGLASDDSYLKRLAGTIADFELRPARAFQSPEQAAAEAWFEDHAYYRRADRSVSYYVSGDVLGTLLDLRIRAATGGRKSLRDLFQWMNAHYARQGRFFDDSRGVQEAAEAVSGASFEEFFREHVRGAGPIDYNQFFGLVGLRLTPVYMETSKAGFDAALSFAGIPRVTSIDPGSAAAAAGVRIGDIISSIDGKPLLSDVDTYLATRKPGEMMIVRFASRSGPQDVKVVLKSVISQSFQFSDIEGVTPGQLAQRKAWIHGEDLPAGGAQ